MNRRTELTPFLFGVLSACLVVGAVVVAGGLFRAADPVEAALVATTEAALGTPVVVPAAAFAADGIDPDSHFFPFGGGYIQGDANNYGCVEAPIYLPNSAYVHHVFASLYDNDDTNQIDITVWRVDNFNGGADVMASITTSGAAEAVQVLGDDTINHPDVSYPDYSYYTTVCVDSSSVRLYSLRVYYHISFTYLPLVVSNA